MKILKKIMIYLFIARSINTLYECKSFEEATNKM